jgi:alpha-D-ribose 1-methylphosphonate 5-triphosphate diphosphatase PhnM
VTTILSNARLVLPDSVVDRGALVIDEAGGIADITTAPIDRIAGADWHDLSGHIVVPGFIECTWRRSADALATATPWPT